MTYGTDDGWPARFTEAAPTFPLCSELCGIQTGGVETWARMTQCSPHTTYTALTHARSRALSTVPEPTGPRGAEVSGTKKRHPTRGARSGRRGNSPDGVMP
jgi:hypothetical protein